jgi:hypothetical protein
MTTLEYFLALHFGLLLAFSAVGLVVNVTSFSIFFFTLPLFLTKIKIIFIYLQIPPSSAAVLPQPDKKGPPPTHPFIVPIASFSILSAFLSYNTVGAGSLSLIYSACTGFVGIWGLWVVSGTLKHSDNYYSP